MSDGPSGAWVDDVVEPCSSDEESAPRGPAGGECGVCYSYGRDRGFVVVCAQRIFDADGYVTFPVVEEVATDVHRDTCYLVGMGSKGLTDGTIDDETFRERVTGEFGAVTALYDLAGGRNRVAGCSDGRSDVREFTPRRYRIGILRFMPSFCKYTYHGVVDAVRGVLPRQRSGE